MSSLDTVLSSAAAQIGKPYVYGEDGPNTFDCSGLITYVFAMIGVHLPHNAAQQQRSSQVKRVSTPQPGDLVFYGNPAHHVALYIGGGYQIAAPHTGANVQKQKVGSGATYGRVSALGLSASGLGSLINTGFEKTGDSAISASLGLDKLIGQVEGVTLNLAFGALGLALFGGGIWLAVSKRGKKLVQSVTG